MRQTWLEVLILTRSLGAYPFLAIMAWSLVTKLQEPAFLVRQGIHLHLESTRSLMFVIAALIGLVPRLISDPDQELGLLRRAHRPLVHGLRFCLAPTIYGGALIAWALALVVAVDQIHRTPSLVASLGPLGLEGIRLVLVCAALSPALRVCSGSTGSVILIWLLACTGLVLILAPVDPGNPQAGQIPSVTFALQSVCCILGGLLLSLGAILTRLRS